MLALPKYMLLKFVFSRRYRSPIGAAIFAYQLPVTSLTHFQLTPYGLLNFQIAILSWYRSKLAGCVKGQSKKADYRSRKKGQFLKMSGTKRLIMRKDHFLKFNGVNIVYMYVYFRLLIHHSGAGN